MGTAYQRRTLGETMQLIQRLTFFGLFAPRSARGGVFTWVVVKQGGAWLIRAAQNTNLGPSNPAQATAK
jgi:hypothetical protein